MKSRSRIMSCFFAVIILVGCASTKTTEREIYVMDNIPKPDRILVYDFGATPEDVPPGPAHVGQYSAKGTAQTSEEIAFGRQLGAQIATDLVERIRDMGLRAEHASQQTRLQINDILLWGYFLSVEKGSRDKRLAIGFRQGVAELKTAIEGFQLTAQGFRKLGSGTVDSGGNKTPGMAVPVAIAIATENPAGLIIGGTMKVAGEVSGRNTIEGRADQTAKEIASALKGRFEQLGWIE
jgi:hypothetical protein